MKKKVRLSALPGVKLSGSVPTGPKKTVYITFDTTESIVVDHGVVVEVESRAPQSLSGIQGQREDGVTPEELEEALDQVYASLWRVLEKQLDRACSSVQARASKNRAMPYGSGNVSL